MSQSLFTCPQAECGRRLRMTEGTIRPGKKFRCPGCESVLIVTPELTLQAAKPHIRRESQPRDPASSARTESPVHSTSGDPSGAMPLPPKEPSGIAVAESQGVDRTQRTFTVIFALLGVVAAGIVGFIIYDFNFKRNGQPSESVTAATPAPAVFTPGPKASGLEAQVPAVRSNAPKQSKAVIQRPRPEETIIRFPLDITSFCWGQDDATLYVACVVPEAPPSNDGSGEALLAAFGELAGAMLDADGKNCPHCDGRGRDPFADPTVQSAPCGVCKGSGVNPTYRPPKKEKPRKQSKLPEPQQPANVCFVMKVNPWTKSHDAIIWLPNRVYGLAYNKQVRRLALACAPRTILTANADDLKLLHRHTATKADVFDMVRYQSVAFSADGSIIAAGNNFDGCTLIHSSDATSIGTYKHKFLKNHGPITSVNLHPNGKQLSFAFSDNPRCRLYNLDAYKSQQRESDTQVNYQVWSADGRRSVAFNSVPGREYHGLFIGSANQAALQRLQCPNGMYRRINQGMWGPGMGRLTISPAGRYAAAQQDASGLAVLWDLDNLAESYVWQAGLGNCQSIQFSPGGLHVAASNYNALRIRSIREITTRPNPYNKDLLQKLSQALTPDRVASAPALTAEEAKSLSQSSGCSADQILQAILTVGKTNDYAKHIWDKNTRAQLCEYLESQSFVLPNVRSAAPVVDSNLKNKWEDLEWKSLSEDFAMRAWRDLLRYFPNSVAATDEAPLKVLSDQNGALVLNQGRSITGQWVFLLEYSPPIDRIERLIDQRFDPVVDFPICRYVELDGTETPLVISRDRLVRELFQAGWLKAKLVSFEGSKRLLK